MTSKQHIILVGGGGHCCSVIDVIETCGMFSIVGIVDVKEKVGQKVSGYKITASDDGLPHLLKQCRNFLITVGHIKTNKTRIILYDKLRKLGADFPVIVSPHAAVSKSASIGDGTVVMHRAVVNRDAVIGKNCIINTGCIIEHNAVIGNHCHISTGAVINGDCVIGDNCFIGSNAVISNNITIGVDAIVGAGSVVIRNVPEKQTVAGNPAILIKRSLKT